MKRTVYTNFNLFFYKKLSNMKKQNELGLYRPAHKDVQEAE